MTIMKKILSNGITIIALAVFVYAGYQLVVIFFDYYSNRQVMEELQDLYYVDAEPEMDVSDRKTNQVRPGFEGLLAQNDEVVGWITIDDTKIDYPVVQTDDNWTYLNRNFYKEETRAGSIFMDYRNDIADDNKNIILYGHRTKDGTMFQHLTKYLEADFVETHDSFIFDTLYTQYEAEIFAVYQTMTDFDYIRTDFSEENSFTSFIEMAKDTSYINRDVEVDNDDIILTLSTCDYVLDREKGRLVVQAKLTEVE